MPYKNMNFNNLINDLKNYCVIWDGSFLANGLIIMFVMIERTRNESIKINDNSIEIFSVSNRVVNINIPKAPPTVFPIPQAHVFALVDTSFGIF